MRRIRLSRGEWEYDELGSLGSGGGFGDVFVGTSAGGTPVAIKRLKLTAPQVAYRELHVAEKLLDRKLVHVLPFLDAGQDADSDHYFTVMPVADRDLQDEIDSRGRLPEDEAVGILLNIVDGLLEVGDLVHRDLKPKNVLLHEGTWKIADFGLARFIEESTSVNTVKDGLTPGFAAPEQWSLERASHATDVYALGCVAYALLTGSPPFRGPSPSDYREQHLRAIPPPLPNVTPVLCSLLSTALRKIPSSRPGVDRVQVQLRVAAGKPGAKVDMSGSVALARSGASEAERLAREEAERTATARMAHTRSQTAAEGSRILKELQEDLWKQIQILAPTVEQRCFNSLERHLELGEAYLVLGSQRKLHVIDEQAFRHSKWDVISGAYINVHHKSRLEMGRGSSLWYMRFIPEGAYRWYEISYYSLASNRKEHPYEPFELLDTHDADLATSNTMCIYCRAFGPVPIDDEDKEAFFQRWMGLLAEASRGQLQHPNKLPLD